MDWIKMEPEVDPLGLQPHDNTYKTEENKDSLKEDNSSEQHTTKVKTDYMDDTYKFSSEIKVEEGRVPFNSSGVKCEAEEDSFDLDRVKEEVKVEVPAEEVEVLTEGIADNFEKSEPSESDEIPRDEDKLTHYRRDSSVIGDISHDSITCNICNEVFVTQQSLKCHLRTHTFRKSLTCDVCGKNFTQMGHLKDHSRIHTGERPYKCDLCGKSFLQSGCLKQHSVIHSDEKPFKCDVCGTCFSQSVQLKSHSRLHTGERPFKCDECGKSFSESGNLKRHTLLHTGERLFKCDDCGKCFSLKGNLNRHKLTHKRKAN
ncbi:oocyte zinc finger protein XlCOF6.1-like isoform X3 [Periplaneta americana]|uniref:oocyte zinc finger protein XlCOF6.1-like isoform X3 n=1 Tax=Periplaneta americana TaxID=6978 RepID=UPI0037E79E06